jgi:hypothetical protein
LRIKFYDKDEPTRIAKTGKWLMFIGAIPLLIELFLLTLANGVPIDMLVVWFEIMPNIGVIILIGLVILLAGWILSKHKKWLTGELELTTNSLEIAGEHKISILYERLHELYNFRNNPTAMRIKSTLYNSLIINFETEAEQQETMERLKNVI